ncbi:MAG: DUF4299 family protein [Lonepinella koalarum]|nr:DUF4299 family protein [Lonepinella koalarum]
MSRTFSIKNKKPFFRKMKVMTVKEILGLIENLEVYNLSNNIEEFNDQINQPLSEFVAVQLGINGISSRLFDASYDQESESYNIRILTPSTRADWKIALSLIQILAQKLGSKVIDEEDIVYDANNIDYEFEKDILFGISTLLDEDRPNPIMIGIHHPFCLSEEQTKKLKETENPMEVFEEMLFENQYLDAYFAKQLFYKKDDEIIGVYTLTQECRTIFPYHASVEFINKDMISDKQITRWQIGFVIYDDEENLDTYKQIGELEYNEFIKKLPSEKYYHIDHSYILVEGFTQDEMKTLLS